MPTLRRRGFTIAELIIVMMIIVLLVAILLPALSSARARARKVAKQSQLASLAAATESYVMAFSSSPGYLADNQFLPNGNFQKFSGVENFVVSMLGGFSSSGSFTIPGTTAKIDPDQVGIGPATASGKRYGAFYSPKPNELGTVSGTQYGQDNAIPEILDADTGMPILYYRAAARSGATKIVDTDGTTASYALFPNVVLVHSSALVSATGEGPVDLRNNSLLCFNNVSATQAADNLAWIVTNSKLSSVSNGATGSANDSSNDVRAGSYVFINPGEDMIYFDDSQNGGSNIDRYDDLDNFDDVWLSGG